MSYNCGWREKYIDCMKKSYIAILILSIINSIVLVGIIIFQIVNNIKTIDSTELFKNNIDSIVEVKASTSDVGESYGSGVIYSSDEYLITNAHVVTYTRLGTTNEFDNYYIRFASEEDYREVSIVKYDNDLDLAVLKLDNVKTKAFKTADSSKFNSGDKVYAIGNTSNKESFLEKNSNV